MTPKHADHKISALRQSIELLARGRNLGGQVDCPECERMMSVAFRTNAKGECHWFACSTSGCLRYWEPTKIRPQKTRKKIVYPQFKMNL